MLHKRINFIKKFIPAGATILIAITMIHSPQATFQAALRGLEMWWHIVVPALFPFFVIAELLLATGVVHFLGIILEPIMRPVFNVPGAGAFVLAIGYTSGAPVGAMLTARLRQQNICTRLEAERLISFTSNASPLFMLCAVAVGMFQDPALGVLIAASHYLANLCLGLCLRFYGNHEYSVSTIQPTASIFRKAAASLIKTQSENYQSLGQLLGEAIRNSSRTLVTIGGFIIIFSVILQILTSIGLLLFISQILSRILFILHLDPSLGHALSNGLFEMTIGTKMVTETGASLQNQLVVAAMILGWAGLSIHAQVASVISRTDIRLFPFILTRFGHSLLAGFFVAFLFKPTRAVFHNLASLPVLHAPLWTHSWLLFTAGSLIATVIILLGLGSLSCCFYLLSRMRLIWLRVPP